MTDSTDFYFREELMAHAKAPRNRGVIRGAEIRHRDSSIMCGDEIEIFARVKNAKITEIKFQGAGCYIVLAAASILTDQLVGRKLAAVLEMKDSDVMELLGAEITPARKKCAMLSLWTVQAGIKNYLNIKKKYNAKQKYS